MRTTISDVDVGVIEEYLLDKLKRSRDGKESSNSSKISMHSKFRHIHNSLEKLLSLSSTQPVRQQGQSLFKEKLYILNDFDEPLLLRSALPRAKNNSYGFEEHLATLERLVVQQKSDEDDEFKAIAIVKTKGIGKTSLCTIVFDNEKVKKRFLPRVWVSMPTPSDEIQKEPQESDSQTYLILARSGRRGELWRNSDSDENYRDLDLGINDHDWKTNNYRTAHALGRRPICEIDDLRQQRGPDLGSRRLRNESGCQSIIMGD
ncbi:hypothetical protein F8388_026359 [Cannabis sativa]|uniref:NB-ARC domain-containing protein n=1 Tax=Cannabis sativa TaxID=3483 RepID=A0A7J6E323_CANSA|nr:hypothetical protein F8388_026359 [Cannabis sativa]